MLVNLTPHALNIHGTGTIINLPPSGQVARVSLTANVVDHVDGVPIYACDVGEVVGLPEPQKGIYYVVSLVVRNAVRDRKDVLSPGMLLRNDEGQPIGCDGLDRNP